MNMVNLTSFYQFHRKKNKDAFSLKQKKSHIVPKTPDLTLDPLGLGLGSTNSLNQFLKDYRD